MGPNAIQMPDFNALVRREYKAGRQQKLEQNFNSALSAEGLGGEGTLNALAAMDPRAGFQISEGRAAREQAQGNADRAFDFDRERFEHSKMIADRNFDLARQREERVAAASAAQRRSAADKQRAAQFGALAGTLLSLPEDQRAAAWPAIRQRVEAMGGNASSLPEAVPGEADLRMLYADLTESVWEPPKQEKSPIAALEARADAAGLTGDARREFILNNGRGKGMQLVVGEDGSVRFGTNGAPEAEFGRAAENELEKDVIAQTDLFQRGARLMEDYDPEFLTYQNQGEAFLTKQAEKLGLDVGEARKEMLRRRTRFTQQVAGVFNAYRKEITGAAAAVQELEQLKEAVINTDQSPTQFEAALELFLDESSRAVRLKRRLLREGVSGANVASALDDLFLAGEDDSWQARAAELKDEGISPAAAAGILRNEGYTK